MSHNRILLAPDDLEVGMLLTVYSRKRKRPSRFMHEFSSPFGMDSEEVEEEHSSLGGIPMRVIALQFPYVICAVILPSGKEDGPKIIDLRTTHLMRISPEYLAGILEFGAKRSAAQDESGEDVSIDPQMAQMLMQAGLPVTPPGMGMSMGMGTLKIEISADDQSPSETPPARRKARVRRDDDTSADTGAGDGKHEDAPSDTSDSEASSSADESHERGEEREE